MKSYASVSTAQLRHLQDAIRDGARSASSVEVAAQHCASTLYEQLADDTALERVYITVPYGQLPAKNLAFVQRLASGAGIAGQLEDTTPVLSLVGTRGALPEWNDRRLSRGHVGIPLAAASFVEAIPMIAGLLQDMGVGLAWLDAQDAGLVEKMVDGGLAGLFYVPAAATARDAAGRLSEGSSSAAD